MASKKSPDKTYIVELGGWEHMAGMHIEAAQKKREGCPYVTRDVIVLHGRIRNPGKRKLEEAQLYLNVTPQSTTEWNAESDILGEAWIVREEATLMGVVPVPEPLYDRILVALTCDAYRQFTITLRNIKSKKAFIVAYTLDPSLSPEATF